MKLKLAYLLFIQIAYSTICFAQIGKILPVDETQKDSTFYKFYCNLRTITNNKDINALASLLTDKLMIAVEGEGKWVSKKEFLKFHNAKDNYKELWNILNDVFTIGGGKFKMEGVGNNKVRCFYAPYIAPSLICNNNDHLLLELWPYSIAIDDSAIVYEKKSKESKIITVLNYDIVENNIENDDVIFPQQWFSIKLKNGDKGFVDGKLIRNVFNVECKFVCIYNHWKVKAIDVVSE
jgi:hypothetical protein